jgi:hypothetical protein
VILDGLPRPIKLVRWRADEATVAADGPRNVGKTATEGSAGAESSPLWQQPSFWLFAVVLAVLGGGMTAAWDAGGLIAVAGTVGALLILAGIRPFFRRHIGPRGE